MDELKPTGFETADALDRFRAVRRGQPFNILWPSDVDEAIEALEDKLNRRPTPENKPLTLEELRKMQGQPVYCIGQTRFDVHFDGWKVVTKNNSMVNVIRFTDGTDFPVDVYGKRLLAYARKPEQEGK